MCSTVPRTKLKNTTSFIADAALHTRLSLENSTAGQLVIQVRQMRVPTMHLTFLKNLTNKVGVDSLERPLVGLIVLIRLLFGLTWVKKSIVNVCDIVCEILSSKDHLRNSLA